MTLWVTSGSAAAVLLAIVLLTPVAPLWRLLLACLVAAGVGALLGVRGWLLAATGLASGVFGMSLELVWELLVVGTDRLRSASPQPKRPPTSNPW